MESGWSGTPDPLLDHTPVKAGTFTGSAIEITVVFPPDQVLNVARAWSGLEAQCVDNLRIFSVTDRVERYVVATGLFTHGLTLAANIGFWSPR